MFKKLRVWQYVVVCGSLAFATKLQAGVPEPNTGSPVFHLDFTELADASGNDLQLLIGDAVSLAAAEGPLLQNGTRLDAGRWLQMFGGV